MVNFREAFVIVLAGSNFVKWLIWNLIGSQFMSVYVYARKRSQNLVREFVIYGGGVPPQALDVFSIHQPTLAV